MGGIWRRMTSTLSRVFGAQLADSFDFLNEYGPPDYGSNSAFPPRYKYLTHCSFLSFNSCEFLRTYRGFRGTRGNRPFGQRRISSTSKAFAAASSHLRTFGGTGVSRSGAEISAKRARLEN